MNQTQMQKRDYSAIGWGLFFAWWGITEIVPSLPHGIGAVGIGLILLGTNAFRARDGLPTSGFSTAMGVLALVLGGLELVKPVLHLPFELPIFGILLAVLGVLLLSKAFTKAQAE